jgi:hypothetical protein
MFHLLTAMPERLLHDGHYGLALLVNKKIKTKYQGIKSGKLVYGGV